MIDAYERALLGTLDQARVLHDTAAIAAFDRRSGREGEAKAIDLLTERLDRAGVSWWLHRYPVWLSDPVRAALTAVGEDGAARRVPCKTWSFCPPSRGTVRGCALVLDASQLEHNPLTLLLSQNSPRERDLDGMIVVTRTCSPVAVLDAGRRGAAAMVCVWPQGDESLIHEGNVNLVWGQPEPWELSLYPAIPVVVTSRGEGEKLIADAARGPLNLELETEVESGLAKIPVLEADISGESDEYVLLGNHLDSWFFGACDNATGNAVALNMAEMFAARRLSRGLKICWWSGHSNGRYAGSAAFCAGSFSSLVRRCLAVCNADMPGLQGATDFGRGSSGVDLRALYAAVVADVTGQTLRPGEWPSGWDLSFKNVGISSCMSWTSTLPDSSPHGTANGFMSWWWHTEADLMEHIDGEILAQDARVYALTLCRLLRPCEFPFNNGALAAELARCLRRYPGTEKLTASLETMHFGRENALSACRLLNRALYAFKDAAAQDWALPLGQTPGLALAASAHARCDRERLALEAFRIAQMNRLSDLISQLENCAG